ncbi:MAG TPA: diaminopimelate epimerase [Dongiaceae bacterium]
MTPDRREIGTSTEPRLRFARMHGCGNDFVVIDDRSTHWMAQRHDLARVLCDRRKGLGGDGLILIGSDTEVDFAMSYTNATGVDGEMCGNGARCVVKRAHDLGLIQSTTTFRTLAGLMRADLHGDLISLAMTTPSAAELNLTLGANGETWTGHAIDTGVPHLVIFTTAIEQVELGRIGPLLRHHPHFPRGVNVNFAEHRGADRYRVRTYERGVEAETLACGTGSVATALIAALLGEARSPVIIDPTGGGELEITFLPAPDGRFTDVRLIGPAETIACGDLDPHWLRARGLA